MVQNDFVLERDSFKSVHRSASSALKRYIDVAGSLVGLGVLTIICLPIALAIRLDSPGSVFYSQVRCGLGGKAFTLYKFRSMVSGADSLRHLVRNESAGHTFKNSRDSRVTRVGRFLRRTSLDELPQFWNVLRGEMSLVGTRPPTLEEVQHYNNRHWQRLLVKSGMTGEWQVHGRSDIKDFEAVVDLDLRYQRLWTPAYDLKLMLRTLWVISRGLGSY